jgi:hypothetical protein
VLLPVVPRVTGEGVATDTPAWFTSSEAAAQRDPVLVVPMPNQFTSYPMTWVAMGGARFPIPGGYFIGPHRGGAGSFGAYPHRPTDHLLQIIELRGFTLRVTPGMRAKAAEDLAHWGTRTIVLGPCAHEDVYEQFLTDLVGRPPESTGGVKVWRDVDLALAAPAPSGVSRR